MAAPTTITVQAASVGIADRIKRLEAIVADERVARSTRIRVAHLIEALEDCLPLVSEADQILLMWNGDDAAR